MRQADVGHRVAGESSAWEATVVRRHLQLSERRGRSPEAVWALPEAI